jgi:hypothetical protein
METHWEQGEIKNKKIPLPPHPLGKKKKDHS